MEYPEISIVDQYATAQAEADRKAKKELYRITAYHPQKDVCAVLDSNGRFEKLLQFSA